MTACSRCGVSAWHPDARSCSLVDCELRAPILLPETRGNPAAAMGSATSGPLPAVPPAAEPVHSHNEELAA